MTLHGTMLHRDIDRGGLYSSRIDRGIFMGHNYELCDL